MSTIGGGSAPGSELPTKLLELAHPSMSADQIEQYLRSLDPPVIVRIHDGRVLLDLRTVLDGETESLAAIRPRA
jgi:L-seryl-tRNA(Ser) seleniumtransferase